MDSEPDGQDENFWRELLRAIEGGTVVPIVGRDLMVVTTKDGPRNFHDLVAERVAAAAELPLLAELSRCPACGGDVGKPVDFDSVPDVNHVLCRAAERSHLQGNPEDFAQEFVTPVVRELADEFEAPEALRKLVSIPPFRLFITTMYDRLLEKAIEAEDLDVTVFARNPTFPAAEELDAVRKSRDPLRVFLFYLFGRAADQETYAFSDAQYLHVMHDLIKSGSAPGTNPVDLLAARHLLLIGVTFPDWLARFLIKAGRPSEQLWRRNTRELRNSREFIVNSAPLSPSLSTFLSLFMDNKSLWLSRTMSSTSFVDELHRRWFALHPQRRPKPARPAATVRPTSAKTYRVFVSYSHEGEDPGHNARVRAFVERLAATGDIVPIADFQVPAPPPANGWNNWSRAAMDSCSKTLMIGSKTYYAIDRGEIPPTGGRGTAAEIKKIRYAIDRNHQRNSFALLILLDAGDEAGMTDLGDWRRRPYGPGGDKEFNEIVRWIKTPTDSDTREHEETEGEDA